MQSSAKNPTNLSRGSVKKMLPELKTIEGIYGEEGIVGYVIGSEKDKNKIIDLLNKGSSK